MQREAIEEASSYEFSNQRFSRYTVPKNPLGLGILGKPPGDYWNGRDLTLIVRGFYLDIIASELSYFSPNLRDYSITVEHTSYYLG